MTVQISGEDSVLRITCRAARNNTEHPDKAAANIIYPLLIEDTDFACDIGLESVACNLKTILRLQQALFLGEFALSHMKQCNPKPNLQFLS